MELYKDNDSKSGTEDEPSLSSDDESNCATEIKTSTYKANDTALIPEFTLVQTKNKRKMQDRTLESDNERTKQRNNRPFGKTKKNITSTNNIYEPLIHQNQESDIMGQTNQRRERKGPPAPIIIKGHPKAPHGTAEFSDKIKQTVKHNFTVKYTRFNTSVYFDDLVDKLAFQAVTTNVNTEFYTYTGWAEKQNAYVMKGLVADLTEAELTDILKEILPGIIKTYTMRTKNDIDIDTDYTQNTPKLYMVITENQIKITDINKIKTVHHTQVTWERHQNARQIIQCHRCQKWRHATTNCHMVPKCLKCAGERLRIYCGAIYA